MSIPVFETEAIIEQPVQASAARRYDKWWALAGFVAFCLIVLSRAPQLLEPDDLAYRASIAALMHGHVLLTNQQYVALQHSIGSGGIMQWHQLSSGMWISEKNPGYPFFAVVFALAGVLRLAPLVAGAVATVGVFMGATKWLGRPAGAFATWFFLASGAALTFAWRATMPSFTDASFVAAGAGWLLWALLPGGTLRQRQLIGAASLVCFDAAFAIRYTNVLFLVLAALTIAITARRVHIAHRTLGVWAFIVLAGLVVVGTANSALYGQPFATGYASGEITFSLSSIGTNLRNMPLRLTTSMPVWILAGIALGWLAVSVMTNRHEYLRRRDAVVGASLATGWLSLWGLYACYSWTANQFSTAVGPNTGSPGLLRPHLAVASSPAMPDLTLHVIRFYLPALGLIALIATWMVMQLRRPLALGVVAFISIPGLLSFHAMAATGSPLTHMRTPPPSPTSGTGGPSRQPAGPGLPPSGHRPPMPLPSPDGGRVAPDGAPSASSPSTTTTVPASTTTVAPPPAPATTTSAIPPVTTSTVPVTTTVCSSFEDHCQRSGTGEGSDDGGSSNDGNHQSGDGN